MKIDGHKGISGPNSIPWRALLLLLIVVSIDTTSQLLLKSAVERAGHAVVLAVVPQGKSASAALVQELLTEPRLWLATLLLSMNFLVWARALSLVDLSVAVPVINLSLATVPIGAYLVLKEEISQQRWLGILLIFIGVMICSFARGKRPLPPPRHLPTVGSEPEARTS
jgi:drug/metabolite transporter (DMT)-like permease